jgi:hypothetical protein
MTAHGKAKKDSKTVVARGSHKAAARGRSGKKASHTVKSKRHVGVKKKSTTPQRKRVPTPKK